MHFLKRIQETGKHITNPLIEYMRHIEKTIMLVIYMVVDSSYLYSLLWLYMKANYLHNTFTQSICFKVLG